MARSYAGLSFKKTAKLFSTVVEPCCIFMNNVRVAASSRLQHAIWSGFINLVIIIDCIGISMWV